jgi:glycosyltransferase involved in cell wall biosynthesis
MPLLAYRDAMPTLQEPRVSIVTPVYNGAPYLAECIESVLAQTYHNWDYTIVNNCSTDRTLEIATKYAEQYGPRLRVHNNPEFLDIIKNHNAAVRQISPESKYCKVVFADDWIFPECIEKMVEAAERLPSAGMVGSYSIAGPKLLFEGLPYEKSFMTGKEICRSTLLGGPYVFGTATTLLMRSDEIRRRRHFYNEENLHADLEVCFDVLQASDFGFVHQVLSYSRQRSDSNDAFASRMETHVLGNLTTFLTYGPIYLEPNEYKVRLKRLMDHYYAVMAKNVLRCRAAEFWNYHRSRLTELNSPLSRMRLLWAVFRYLGASAFHPLDAIDGVFKWWPAAVAQLRARNVDTHGASTRRAA